jgi:hypothetical protein
MGRWTKVDATVLLCSGESAVGLYYVNMCARMVEEGRLMKVVLWVKGSQF